MTGPPSSAANSAEQEREASLGLTGEASPALSRPHVALLVILCLSAVVVRLLFAWFRLPPPESDFHWYRLTGLAAARHGLLSLFAPEPPVPAWVFTLWPPGYPLFLGLVYSVDASIWAAPVVQAALGGATCALLFAAARRWGANPWTAAAIIAFHPQAIVYSAIHGAETLTLFLLAIGLVASLSPLRTRGAATYGFSLGLAVLTRCHTALLLPGVAASLWRRGRALVVVGACIALALAPWAVSRARIHGRPVPLTTFFGHLLYMGNYRDNPAGGYYNAPRPEGIPGDATPPEEDIYFLAAGVREILLHPSHYLLVSGRRLVTWTGLDRDEWVQKYAPPWLAGLAVLLQLVLFFVASAAAIETWRDPRARHVTWPALSLIALTVLTYHMPRYTLVGAPFFALLASRLRLTHDRP